MTFEFWRDIRIRPDMTTNDSRTQIEYLITIDVTDNIETIIYDIVWQFYRFLKQPSEVDLLEPPAVFARFGYKPVISVFMNKAHPLYPLFKSQLDSPDAKIFGKLTVGGEYGYLQYIDQRVPKCILSVCEVKNAVDLTRNIAIGIVAVHYYHDPDEPGDIKLLNNGGLDVGFGREGGQSNLDSLRLRLISVGFKFGSGRIDQVVKTTETVKNITL